MSKINVIFLSPGPIYNPTCPLVQSKYAALSQFMRGYILTTADNDEEIRMGEFRYISKSRKKIIYIRYLFFCLIKAYKINKKETVDCIITYDPLKTGLVGCFLRKILKAKLVVEVNGVYTSKTAWSGNSEGLITVIKKHCASMVMRYVFRSSDGIKLLFPSQIKKFTSIVQNKKITVFPDWVPTSFFVDLCEKKEVLLIGFPFLIKGVDILIESFKLIAPKFPDWELKILGWYPNSTVLDAAIAGHSQISHYPPVPYSEIPYHIGKCGLFVLPSRTEAMGRVLLEAAAAGKPRIGSNVDGIPTVINDGVDGFLVEPENVEQLAEKMSLLMANAQLRKKFGVAAKKRANVEFTEARYVENILSFIKDVVSE